MLVSMLTDKPSVLLPLWPCWNLESSLKHHQAIMEDIMKGGWMRTWTTMSSPMWYSPLANMRQSFPSLSSPPLIRELTLNSCQRICCGTLVEWGACYKEHRRQMLASSFLKCRGIFNALHIPVLAQLPFLAWQWSGLECGKTHLQWTQLNSTMN